MLRIYGLGGQAFGSLPETYNPAFTEFNGELYFIADDGEKGRELWKTDGATVVRLTDITEGVGDSLSLSLPARSGTPLIAFDDALYFVAENRRNGLGLWRTDGTSVTEVANPNPRTSFVRSSIMANGLRYGRPDFRVYGDALYFYADDGTAGVQLWKTDGAETVPVTRTGDGPFDIRVRDEIEFDGELYFWAENAAPEVALLDGNAPRNRLHFDSRVLEVAIPADASFRLKFVGQNLEAGVGYIWGLDNVQLQFLAAGDANGDGRVDPLDIVSAAQADTYLTGQRATWSQGDWTGDGLFDQADIVAVLQSGKYLKGQYAVAQ